MIALTHEERTRLAGEATVPTQPFVGGKFVPAASQATFENRNPATGALLVQVATVGRQKD